MSLVGIGSIQSSSAGGGGGGRITPAIGVWRHATKIMKNSSVRAEVLTFKEHQQTLRVPAGNLMLSSLAFRFGEHTAA